MLSNLYNVLVIGIMQQEYKNSKIRTSISLVQISKSYAFCFSKFHIESESVCNLVPSITVFKLYDTIKCSVICTMPWQYNTILFFFYFFFAIFCLCGQISAILIFHGKLHMPGDYKFLIG